VKGNSRARNDDGVIAVDELSKGLDPTTRAFLNSINMKKERGIHELPLDQGRGALAILQAVAVDRPEAEIEDLIVPGKPRGEIPIRIVRPPGKPGLLPAIIYSHGGGWVFGDRDIFDRLLRDLACGAQAAVVFVDYSRSPEARYPIAIEEIYTVASYLSKRGKVLGIDPSRLVAAGDSVGGNMAAVLTILAKQRGGPRIGLQVLFYPVTDADFERESYRIFSAGHFLTRDAMRWFWNQYLPNEVVRKDPTASPLRASLDQLSGLPPALIITGEFDILRDEGEAYAHKLIEAGVPVTAVRVHGTIHDFVLLNAIAGTPPARSAIAMASDHCRRFFNGRDPTC